MGNDDSNWFSPSGKFDFGSGFNLVYYFREIGTRFCNGIPFTHNLMYIEMYIRTIRSTIRRPTSVTIVLLVSAWPIALAIPNPEPNTHCSPGTPFRLR